MTSVPPSPVPERTRHPFHNYDMIRAIPRSFEVTLAQTRNASLNGTHSGVLFTGSGTGFYSAWMGSQLLGALGMQWNAVHALELPHYHKMPKGGSVVGVSHSGITKSTLDALQAAKADGSRTFGITHFAGRPIEKAVDVTLVVGDGPDKSRCHTKTYTDSAAACFALSARHAAEDGHDVVHVADEFQNLVHPRLEEVTAKTEEPMQKLAEEVEAVSRIFFAGAGPNLVTAREAALKVKESSFISAEGMEMEEFLHGPWVAVNKETLVVVISPSGPSNDRAKTIIAACREIGAKTVAVSDIELGADLEVRVPSSHEYLSPFLTIVPLYFLAYFLAVGRGSNPDMLRYLEADYWRARNVVFPAGTH